MQRIEQIIADKITDGQPITPAEAEQFVIDVPPRTESTIFRGDNGLRRSQAFLDMLGNPQNIIPAIHIAGTSGKGSVAQLTTNLLLAHGFHTGTYSSPHVYNLSERWLLDGQQKPGLLPEVIPRLHTAIKDISASPWGPPTYFEITTSIGFLLFENRADYMVIETGMGGLYDTTNTINRQDKLAIISELGLDHTHILGDTLAEIATHKAGILPHGGHAIILEPTDTSALDTIKALAQERSTTLHFVKPGTYKVLNVALDGTGFEYYGAQLELTNAHTSMVGSHQIKNIALALRALEFLSERDGFALNESAIRETLQHTQLPGRFERRTIDGKQFIFDGAHNPQKLGALAEVLRAALPGKTFTWVMAFGKNKDVLASLTLLAPLIDTLYVTSFFANQDMPLSSKAMALDELANIAHRARIKSVVLEADNQKALALAATTANEQPIIAAGSFYFLGDVAAKL
ncbi:MAG: Mur ligase family protein [Candidatus Saccharimonadales bacterium]